MRGKSRGVLGRRRKGCAGRERALGLTRESTTTRSAPAPAPVLLPDPDPPPLRLPNREGKKRARR